MFMMGLFRRLHRWIFFAVAFVSGSLLTYVMVLTPRIVNNKSAPILYNLRGLNLLPSSNSSTDTFMWRQRDLNYSRVIQQKNGKLDEFNVIFCSTEISSGIFKILLHLICLKISV